MALWQFTPIPLPADGLSDGTVQVLRVGPERLDTGEVKVARGRLFRTWSGSFP